MSGTARDLNIVYLRGTVTETDIQPVAATQVLVRHRYTLRVDLECGDEEASALVDAVRIYTGKESDELPLIRPGDAVFVEGLLCLEKDPGSREAPKPSVVIKEIIKLPKEERFPCKVDAGAWRTGTFGK